MNYLLLFGVAVCAIAGALAAAPRKMDVFGVVVVATVTALGGGTVRDVLMGHQSFWIREPVYVVVAVIAALVTFVAARFVRMPMRALLVFDAFGLAMFTIVGCQKGLEVHASYVVVALMGVITGVAGGIVRDLLCDEVPHVFYRGELYATASFIGCLAFIALYAFGVTGTEAVVTGVLTTLVVRLAAIRWRITLPKFVVRESE